MNLLSARLAELVGDLQVLRGQFRIALAAAVRETACRATGDAIDRLWPKLTQRSTYPQRRYHDDPWREEEEERAWEEDSSYPSQSLLAPNRAPLAEVLPGSRKTPFFVLLLFGLLTSVVTIFLKPPLKSQELFDLFLALRAAALD
jgi:hypothetical protein